MTQAVQVRGLSKRYGSRTVIDRLELSLEIGVTGLLGPNGAGKTTLLRCLATTLAPDSGVIDALGCNPAVPDERTALRARLGYLPQDPGFYPHFSASDMVDYVAILKNIKDRGQRHREVRRVLAEVALADRSSTKVRKLSGGMKQRLALAQALLGSPELLILDEPMVGLDPEQRMRIRSLVSNIGETNVVLLSTHQTEDVAALCERVVVLNHGLIVFDGTPMELAGSAAGRVWMVAERPSGGLYWRTADGRFRILGDRTTGADAVEPSVEDGYLLQLGQLASA